MDTLRADRILKKKEGIYLTPNMKNLLNHSYYFENCISNHTWTLPSHNSLFTGLYSSQIKKIGGKLYNIVDKLPLLAELLRKEGYQTICFTENPWINAFFKNVRGFDIYIRNLRRSFYLLEHEKVYKKIEIVFDFLRKKILKWFKPQIINFYFDLFEEGIKKIITNFLYSLYWKKWLFEYKNTLNQLDKLKLKLERRVIQNPYFLFLNVMPTHSPYIPTKKILDKFGIHSEQIKIIKNFLLKPTHYFRDINYRSLNLNGIQISTLNTLYNACVKYSDSIVNKIVNNFENFDNERDTYLIFTSDHGEHLCSEKDHNLYGHGISYSVFDTLIKVPLIIYNKNLREHCIKEQVQLKDIFHTILELIKLQKKTALYDPNKSLLFQVKNKMTPKYIYGEHLKRKDEMLSIIRNNRPFLTKDLVKKIFYDIFFLRTQKYKYIKYENGLEEIYRLDEDPYEQNNIIKNNPPITSELRKKMQQFRTQIDDINEISKEITEKEKLIVKKIIRELKL